MIESLGKFQVSQRLPTVLGTFNLSVALLLTHAAVCVILHGRFFLQTVNLP